MTYRGGMGVGLGQSFKMERIYIHTDTHLLLIHVMIGQKPTQILQSNYLSIKTKSKIKMIKKIVALGRQTLKEKKKKNTEIPILETLMARLFIINFLYLIYVKNTSCKMIVWMSYKLESRLPGEIATTSEMGMIPF